MLGSRTRRIAKWMAVLALAVLTVIAVASRWWQVDRSGEDIVLRIVSGGILIRWSAVDDHPTTMSSGSAQHPRWSISNTRGGPASIWWFGYWHVTPSSYWHVAPSGPSYHILRVPLWAPLLAYAILTAWLWRRNRRYPPGHCRKCGYDLTGNVTHACSECGEKVDEAATVKDSPLPGS